MAVSGTRTVEVAAAPDEVLQVVRDVAGQPSWWPGMLEAEVLDVDAEGRAARARIVNDVKVAKDEFEVHYTHEDDALRWELARPSRAQRHQQGAWTVAPSSAGTTVTLELTIDTSLPLPGFVQRKVLNDTLTGATEGLARHVAG